MKLRRKEITLFRAAECLNVTVHTLATYLSTLQGAERISLTSDINMSQLASHEPPNSNELDNNADAIAAANDILQRLNAANLPLPPAISATSIKREGGGYIDLPQVGGTVPKSNASVLENNPDITIVKAENMNRPGMQGNQNKYTKLTASENNNAKLMSGGGLSELTQAQHQNSQIQIHPVVPQHNSPQRQQHSPQQQQLIQQQQQQQSQQQQQNQQQQQVQQQQQKFADAMANDLNKP